MTAESAAGRSQIPAELRSSTNPTDAMNSMKVIASAGKGVTQVIERCENAKASGYLDLSSCSLMYLADAIYLVLKGYEITKCNLRDNALKKFPKKLCTKFPNMTVFNIEGNSLDEIPEEVSAWTEMKGLNLANNNLSEFPIALYTMKQLKILDLSGNHLIDLDTKSFYEAFPKMVHLNLSGNPLSEAAKSRLSKSKPEVLRVLF